MTSGSGSLTIDSVGGALTVSTGSSAFLGRALKDISGGGPLVRVNSRSGAVRITVASDGHSPAASPIAAVRN